MDKSNIASDMWQGCVIGANRKKKQAKKRGDITEANKQSIIEDNCRKLRDNSKKQ